MALEASALIAAQIAEEWVSAMNAHNVERMVSLLTEDAIADEVVENKPREGRESIAGAYREVFAGYPDCKAEILNLIVDSDQAVVEVRFKGTNNGAFRGTPATDRPIDLRIAYILKVKNGRICKVTEYYDLATVLTQQGLMTK
jgi:steroid delta-isomerase-like uncharacterized protein